MTEQKKEQEQPKVVYVKKGEGEFTEDELAKVSGGMMPRGKYSKTINVEVGYTDVDAAF